MTVDISPLLLLALAAALLPWRHVAACVRAVVFKIRLALLLTRLRDNFGDGARTVLVYTGPMERADTFALVRQIRAAPSYLPLVLVLDTTGGDVSAGLQVMHALAAHRGRVIVRVPDECWSSGTVAALGADAIILAPDANLGFCDPIFKGDPSWVHTGPVMTAAARGEPIDIVRARHSHRDLVRSIAAAREVRGETPADARALAERMVCSDTDHWQPLFIEEARDLGLPVRVDADPAWYEVVRLSTWGRWPR